MVSTKALFGAWGAVAVGATECDYAEVKQLEEVHVTDIAVDASQVFVTAVLPDTDKQFGYEFGQVWMCDAFGIDNCTGIAPLVEKKAGATFHWDNPRGIAVDLAADGSRTVYIAQSSLGQPNNPYGSVSKCTFVGPLTNGDLDCIPFDELCNERWERTQQLALDSNGNVLVTANGENASAPHGVWTCPPSGGLCIGPQDDQVLGTPATGVAADTQGNVYVAGEFPSTDTTSFVDECYGSDPSYGCRSYRRAKDISGKVGIAASPMAYSAGTADVLYIRDESSLLRCEHIGDCENISDCEYKGPSGFSNPDSLPSQSMAVNDSFVYSAINSYRTYRPQPYSKLYRYHFSSNDNFQI